MGSLQSLDLEQCHYPHDENSITKLLEKTGYKIMELNLADDAGLFPSIAELKEFILSWIGGFEFYNALDQKHDKNSLMIW